jgi:hypothetical protein
VAGLDDLFDLSEPEGLTFALASGVLDDDERCACTCGCTTIVETFGDLCTPCEEGDHPGDDD